MVWFRITDDIFFIWTGNKDSLDHFISFTHNYSESENMESKIQFEIHLSTNEVHFLDVTVSLKHGKLKATIFTKPADSHFFELLRDRTRENKDPQTILVSTWHPKLSAIPSILKNNFHLISANRRLSKIFKQKNNATYQKNKSLSGYLLKNDIANQQLHSHVALCRNANFAHK